MQTTNHAIGIDIGGTTTTFGFVDRQGALVCETTLPTPADQQAGVLVARLHDAIETLRRKLSPETGISGIGIGAPNANYHRGTVETRRILIGGRQSTWWSCSGSGTICRLRSLTMPTRRQLASCSSVAPAE